MIYELPLPHCPRKMEVITEKFYEKLEELAKKIEELGQSQIRHDVKLELVCKKVEKYIEMVEEILNKPVNNERRIEALEKNQRWVAVGLIGGLGMIFFKLIERFL